MYQGSILLVDDNELLRWVMVRFFSREFSDVVAVGSGCEAMERVSAGHFHGVILDRGLPDADGLDILEFIRSKSPGSRVVMITADVRQSVRLKAFELGVSAFFEKPFDLLDVCASLGGCTGERGSGLL